MVIVTIINQGQVTHLCSLLYLLFALYLILKIGVRLIYINKNFLNDRKGIVI